MIDQRAYNLIAFGTDTPPRWMTGEQELILAEVVGALAGCKRVWLPFRGRALMLALDRIGIETVSSYDYQHVWPAHCDAIYFGTPTIVADRPLFPMPEHSDDFWTKDKERSVVRSLSAAARLNRARIVCGLGSGDILLDERLTDIGGGRVIAYKDFGEFKDWVICGS